ncbi:hypothetical protein Shel_14910 [Slackia heliotrinireducens DSM 20476]|uniref:Uncharacterized protein n=1 Tax=Slackia heliotrinireducens (strain ATCC 29202 / DSM 20476 / NCTC 11029 / RHS 1) TaxID=471855 RepID=C7N6H6_SLAHD|nr:hypothetical protein Shel_14910 [Slackia heliotrinireducens DSM 20476]
MNFCMGGSFLSLIKRLALHIVEHVLSDVTEPFRIQTAPVRIQEKARISCFFLGLTKQFIRAFALHPAAEWSAYYQTQPHVTIRIFDSALIIQSHLSSHSEETQDERHIPGTFIRSPAQAHASRAQFRTTRNVQWTFRQSRTV